MYDYNRGYYRLGSMGMMTPAVKNLILANVVVYLMEILNPNLGYTLIRHFALTPYEIIYKFKIWQLVTYMFLHDPSGIMHILFNMLYLWMFGIEIEREWGTREFLKYYFISGVGAAVFNLVLSGSTTIGASGAVYGIMLAYALRFPDRMIYIYFLFPVKIKYFMGFLIFVQFISTFSAFDDGIAHAAHLGGIVVGYIYLRYGYFFYRFKGTISRYFKKGGQNFTYTKGGDDKTEYYRRVIDELLDKINRVGYLNLTDEEKRLLEEGSKYLREHENKN